MELPLTDDDDELTEVPEKLPRLMIATTYFCFFSMVPFRAKTGCNVVTKITLSVLYNDVSPSDPDSRLLARVMLIDTCSVSVMFIPAKGFVDVIEEFFFEEESDSVTFVRFPEVIVVLSVVLPARVEFSLCVLLSLPISSEMLISDDPSGCGKFTKSSDVGLKVILTEVVI